MKKNTAEHKKSVFQLEIHKSKKYRKTHSLHKAMKLFSQSKL